jgi:hypothetical protein
MCLYVLSSVFWCPLQFSKNCGYIQVLLVILMLRGSLNTLTYTLCNMTSHSMDYINVRRKCNLRPYTIVKLFVSIATFTSFWVVILCVFTFWVQCFDVRCNFRMKTMFALSLPPVVCRRIHVLFTLFCVCLHIEVSNTYCVVFLLWLFSSGILYIASFSGLSIFYCHFGFHIFFTTFYET